jgi:steroid 5-alpha reductase family enzyme
MSFFPLPTGPDAMLATLLRTGIASASPLIALTVTALVFAALWRLSVKKSDCGVVDLYWAFGFSVIAAIEFAALPAAGTGQGLLLALTLIWSARLGWHLVARHRQDRGEDPRYAKMRREGGPDWPSKSFWWVFMLQAGVMWLVATPLHAAFTTMSPQSSGWALGFGVSLFAVGFVIETAADAAIARFRDDPAKRGTLLVTGLFAWSRHPNYFGEAVLWWGLGLVALSVGGAWWALAGPLILTILLVKVSGVPMLDAHLSTRPGFEDYAARTSAFLPLPPRRTAMSPLARKPADRR